MLKLAGLLTLSLAAFAAQAQDSGIADKTTNAEPASADAAAPAESAADEAKEPFKPPPGFQTRKRGELVLYCKRDATLGTRFKTEKCYDEPQMREYMLALEQQKLDVDRIRGTCGGGDACAMPDPTANR
jgi:hypothetical protein